MANGKKKQFNIVDEIVRDVVGGAPEGGGVANWNDLEGEIPKEKLPEALRFGEEVTENVLYEGTVTNKTVLNLSFDFMSKAGTFDIVFDGETYSSEKTGSTDSTGAYVYGNPVIIYHGTDEYYSRPNDNGLPFAILAPYDGAPIIYTTDSETHSCVFKTSEKITTLLSGEYLPEALRFGEKEVLTPLLEEQSFTETPTSISAIFANAGLDSGDVIVVCDGVEYAESLRYDVDSGALYVGGLPDRPYCIKEYSGLEGWVEIAEGETHTISVYAKTVEVTPLDSDYLPKATAVADVTDAPTAQNFNALLASLRAAGYLAE